MPPHADSCSLIDCESSSSVSSIETTMEETKPLTPPPTTTEEEVQRQQPPNKSVRFHGQCNVYLIPALDDYSQIERYLVWHERGEYEAFREDCMVVIDLMNRGVPEHEDLCFRGLEWKQPGSSKKRRYVRKQAQLAVFEEQENQWKRDEEVSPERIAAACQPYNMMCCQEAFQRGCDDATEASIIYAAADCADDLPTGSAATSTSNEKKRRSSKTQPTMTNSAHLVKISRRGSHGAARRVVKVPNNLFSPQTTLSSRR